MLSSTTRIALCTSRGHSRCFVSSSRLSSQKIPWFVTPDDPDDFPLEARLKQRRTPSLQTTSQVPPLPRDVPDHLRELHSALCVSPFLETSALTVTRPVQPLPAPPLPVLRSRGVRRKRGGTDAGDGIAMPGNGIWSWFVMAQVKEGTEMKGSINNVVKGIRTVVPLRDPKLVLPPNRRYNSTDGWALLDVGDFAVHVLSREARQKWFPDPNIPIIP
ncbi:hypothetical protein BU17DRAFT_47018 [Hysterangium stoloniferum]|nr:hypothetical protein BU17DRAFT_47018 [Hysterangium stoloniferum]